MTVRVLLVLAMFMCAGRVGATQIGLFDPATLKPSVTVGDLYIVLNGKPTKRLTTWGYNPIPSISWNKRFAVYQSETQSYTDKYKREPSCAGNPTTNLYLIDLNNLRIRKLTDGQRWARSKVVWSPDSRYYAWTEYETMSNSAIKLRLLVASPDQQKPREILSDVPSVGGEGSDYFPQLDWLKVGLVIIGNPEDDENEDCVLVNPSRQWEVRRAKVNYADGGSCYFALGL